MPLDINTYDLLEPESIPQPIKDSFKPSGFSPAYRSFLIGRLPTANVEREVFLCLYCGEMVGRRSTQIEHLIPARVFCRSKLLREFGHREVEKHAFDFKVKAACLESSNLVLACNTCNAGKGDAALDSSTVGKYKTIIKNSTLSEKKKTELVNKLDSALRTIEHFQADERKYFMKGPGTIRRSTRQEDISDSTSSGPTRRKEQIKSPRVTPYARPINKTWTPDLAKAALEDSIITVLGGGSRPDWNINGPGEHPRKSLEKIQILPKATIDSKLCFYCLGWFSDAAFQIDHIQPTTNKSVTGQIKSVYNNSKNLIPVCRTCNVSKGARMLSKEMINDLIKKREVEGLAGLIGDDKVRGLTRSLKMFGLT
jgi:5-methylcytosine-specific restriction endonuclease McrA